MHPSNERDECEGGQSSLLRSSLGEGDETVVGLIDECIVTNGGTVPGMGTLFANFSNSHSLRSEPSGGSVREKNHGFQASCDISRTRDRSADVVSKGGADEGDAGADWMEFEGGGHVDASC